MALSNCTGHLEGLQQATFIYGYIEAVVWGILIVVTLVLLIGGCVELRPKYGPTKLCGGIMTLVLACTVECTCIMFIIYAVVHILSDVALIKGLQNHNSKLVLSYFIYGVISDILRLLLPTFLLTTFSNQTGRDTKMNVAIGINIAIIVFTLLHFGVLWVVFCCYQQIKADPYCLHHY